MLKKSNLVQKQCKDSNQLYRESQIILYVS